MDKNEQTASDDQPETTSISDMLLLDSAMRVAAFSVKHGGLAGWWDTQGNADINAIGERLVKAGTWERHARNYGTRSFYRPIKEDSETTQPAKPTGFNPDGTLEDPSAANLPTDDAQRDALRGTRGSHRQTKKETAEGDDQ